MILGMLWPVYHNSEINQRIEEVKITRYPEKCGKQWRPKQKKLEWQKQEEEKKKEEEEKKKEKKKQKKEENKKKKPKKERTVEVKRIAKEQKIWDKKEEVVKLEKEAKKLVSLRFYKQIYVFGKKISEKVLTNKV